MLKLVSILGAIGHQYGLKLGMKKLFGSLEKKGKGMNADSELMGNKVPQEKKSPMTRQQKLMVLGGVILLCILVFQLFTMSDQKEAQAQHQALQLHIEDQAGVTRNTLADIIHAETEQIRKSADAKVAELKQMILNNSTEVITQLQQLQMKVDEVQNQTESFDKLSDELVQKLSAKLQHAPAAKAGIEKTDSVQTIPFASSTADKLATNYRIYSVNSYGLVLQAEDGTFTIANIGKVLPNLGEITSMTTNEVVAGDYKIIANPAGFKVNETAAISSY
ncbi:hypothetical protein [Caedibacter taeniospiralis]|jgi:type II secretory pathway component PulM|uniref:hypothetical protein n=1 Tax=Caedibacter taeniospiralis TaxID=28907 RepID=UPI0037BE3DB7